MSHNETWVLCKTEEYLDMSTEALVVLVFAILIVALVFSAIEILRLRKRCSVLRRKNDKLRDLAIVVKHADMSMPDKLGIFGSVGLRIPLTTLPSRITVRVQRNPEKGWFVSDIRLLRLAIYGRDGVGKRCVFVGEAIDEGILTVEDLDYMLDRAMQHFAQYGEWESDRLLPKE
jgi:hypothetical protein